MAGFIVGLNRSQSTLFPETLDDYIHEDNSVRVVDAFIDELNLSKLGFIRTEPCQTGRPGYDPATLLKLYLYGYLNRIQSSRRLERESQRNVELMWLLQKLTPDFKTIADFRKDNAAGIKNTCRAFVDLCRKLNMFEDAVIAVDGSKFKAVNNSDRNYTKTNIKRRIERTEKHIEKYLAQLDDSDQNDTSSSKEQITNKVAVLKSHLAKLESIKLKISSGPESQVSLTDPDCRAMKTRSIGRTIGYNVQTAVDTNHHLIVANYVTNAVSDRCELSTIAKLAQEALGKQEMIVLADKGYYSGWEIKQTQDNGMIPIVPKTHTSGNFKKGLFTKQDFRYEPEHDQYRCPVGEPMKWRFSTEEQGKTIHKYWSSSCPTCRLKTQCTTSKYRRISRWEHEDRLDEMEEILQSWPDSMNLRKSTVEHPFGTIKSWMGATHFLTRRIKNVSTEINLSVLAYNFKRMINIIGSAALIEAIKA